MSAGNPIRAVGLVHVVDGRLLLVRSKKQSAFYLPGGKIDPGETELHALHREVREELGLVLRPRSERFVGRYVTDACGQGVGVRVNLGCYAAEVEGAPRPAAEIAEVEWMTAVEYGARPETAPAVVALWNDLSAVTGSA
ncbi:NUDIX hydrolase [Parasphingorhabdus pacifica]